jgi:hypothetical protein
VATTVGHGIKPYHFDVGGYFHDVFWGSLHAWLHLALVCAGVVGVALLVIVVLWPYYEEAMDG